jgi:6-phosphogluconolactonase
MSPHRFVFIGTYTEPILFGTGQILQGQGKGIYTYRFDTASGALEPSGLIEGVRNPSYLAIHPSHHYLYAVNEYKEFEGQPSGAISSFRLDPETGTLEFINQKATHGTDPCHLFIDPTGQCVMVANFASGSVCVLPIKQDGSLADASDVVQHHGSSVNPARQAGPHAHATTLDLSGRYAFVPDLGLDKVMIYQLDAVRGTLKPNSTPWIATVPGAGPRQIVMHPGGRFAYLINELNSTVTAFRYYAGRGTLQEIHTLPTLPEGFSGSSSCAELQISPAGDLLYGSNRGHDSLAIYRIDPTDGGLSSVGFQSTLGQIPRNFTVEPGGNWVLVANQDSQNIAVFRVDHGTGGLVPVSSDTHAPTPVCIKML